MNIGAHYLGKRVVVTGCSSGIGQATARLLVEAGADVHGLDIKPAELDLASFRYLDLRDLRSIESAALSISGPIDALFNCAGIPPGPSPIDVMKVNFVGTRYLTELLVPKMAPGSAVANVASNGGAGWPQRLALLKELTATESFEAAAAWYEQNAPALPSAYSVSKEAVIVWTMRASGDWIKRGIRVNCTSPGAVQTPMLDEIQKVTPAALIDVVAQPIGRRSSAEEQAWPLLFLNCPLASYINGATLPVDGGFIASGIVAAR